MTFETMIVDDDEMVIFLHKIAVVESGLTAKPVVAFNGSQALDHILEHSETSFLILLDINMPEMDGWEFLDAIQNHSAKLFIVMVTSSVDSRDRNKALRYAQVIDYIEKPLSADKCARIKSKLAG